MPTSPSTRLGLIGPSGTDDINLGDDDIRAMITQLEAVGAGYKIGTSRPAAAAAFAGFVYINTSTGLVSVCTGSSWIDVNPSGVFQPLDSDLTSIAALSTTAFGRGLLEAASAANLRTSAGLDVTGGVLNYNQAAATEIGLGYPIPQTKATIECKGQRPVLLMARGVYRNNTAATQTPSWTFARRPGGDPGNIGTGWTRIGHGGGAQSVGSGSAGAGNGPLLPLQSFFVDVPPSADAEYTYALWLENGADNPGFGSSSLGYYALLETSFSAVQL